MDSLQPAILSAVVLCLGGGGLLVTRDGTSAAGRSTLWVAFTTWGMSLAVFLFATALGSGDNAHDDFLRVSDDRVTQIAAILLFLMSGCGLLLPNADAESQRPSSAGFLMLGTSAGLLAAASNSLLLTAFFGEVALGAWLLEKGNLSGANDAERKRRVRDALAAGLLLSSLAIIAISAGADRFDSIAAVLNARLEQSVGDPSERDVSIGLAIGLIGFVTAAAWRLSFFPFSSLQSSDDSAAELRPFAISLLTTLLLVRITPAIRGAEELMQVLLCTFGGATFFYRLVRIGQGETWSHFLDHSLTVTLALLWISLSGQLFEQQHQIPAVGGLPSPTWLRGWSLGLGAWLLLGAIARVSSQAGHPLKHREDLAGWSQGHSVLAGLCCVTVLGWLSALGLPWPTLQRGLLASLFRLGGSGFHAGAGYVVLALAALIGIGWWVAVALRWLTPLYTATALRRAPSRIPLISVAVLLVIAAVLVWFAGVTSGESLPLANKVRENLPSR